VVIAPHRALIKSSKTPQNKGFIAVCPPYPLCNGDCGERDNFFRNKQAAGRNLCCLLTFSVILIIIYQVMQNS